MKKHLSGIQLAVYNGLLFGFISALIFCFSYYAFLNIGVGFVCFLFLVFSFYVTIKTHKMEQKHRLLMQIIIFAESLGFGLILILLTNQIFEKIYSAISVYKKMTIVNSLNFIIKFTIYSNILPIVSIIFCGILTFIRNTKVNFDDDAIDNAFDDVSAKKGDENG